LIIQRDTADKVARIAEFVKNAQSAGSNQAIQLVVYDMPDRDCSAAASNGEYSIADGGAQKYRAYIDSIAAQIKAAPDVKFILAVGK